MAEKTDHIEAARDHFKTRAERRPLQHWDEDHKQWVHTARLSKEA